MEIPIILAAMGFLREGKIAPLLVEDIAKIREAVKDKSPGDRLCDMPPAMIYYSPAKI